ncbi:type IV pilus assembly protein PilM [Motiliproteus sp. SC1-56]|uniref:type IV pilus assembly protein PilM n=1 Tax=Motiliproteus sp. SC1-56 TaxID=2799565 RepID=UPI001A90A909
MISFFKSKSKSLLGVDIGSSYVKLLGLSQSSQGFKVDSYAVSHLPEGAVIDNNVQDVPVVAEALEKALRVSGSRLKPAVTSVPASVVIVKNLEFSKSFTEDELEEQIKVEADQFIPYPLDEVAIDFQIKGESATSPDLNEVLLVACRQDSVQSREDAVNGAGMTCDVIDVDTYALERAFKPLSAVHELEGKTVGLVDIGASSMTLYVFDGGEVIYSREQAFGGNDLTHNLTQITDMTADEAERAKKLGELPDDLVRDYIEPFKQTTAQQISRSLQFYYSSGTHGEIECLLLMGGVAALPEIADTVTQELGVRTEIADPFRDMAIDSRINRGKFDIEASSLVLACGLALRSFED